MKDMKQECLEALTLAGVGDENLASWYEAIYTHPDMSHVKQEIAEIITKITLDDILSLSQAYLMSGALAGATRTVDYFRRLYKIDQDITVNRGDPLARFAEESGICCYYIAEIDRQELVRSEVLVGNQLRNRTIATYVKAISHEIWHAHQTMHRLKWLRTSDRNLNITPDLVPLGARYAVNMKRVVYSYEDLAGYVQQLIEQEAYLACDRIMNRIEQLLQAAYLRGDITQQGIIFYNIPIYLN